MIWAKGLSSPLSHPLCVGDNQSLPFNFFIVLLLHPRNCSSEATQYIRHESVEGTVIALTSTVVLARDY